MASGNNTLFPRKYEDIPAEQRKDVTYDRVVVDYRPQKEYPNCTRLTVGGESIKYPGDVSTPTVDLTTAKVVINNTISNPGTCAATSEFLFGKPVG